MKQPQNTVKGNNKVAKVKRKSREEVDAEARARKRAKKHRGNSAGARTNVDSQSGKNQKSVGAFKDPRIGSKTPVPLIVEGNQSVVAKPKAPKPPKATSVPPEQELALLENDDRLNELLDAIDDGKELSAAEQRYVDNTLDRIDELMSILGIDLGDDEDDLLDEPQEPKEDIVKLLKRNSPQE
ncbi:Der GTPase-activating protein YihI [Jinshanibacter sp. LJY008]|uniref:Der GTPase-activating protein YihI n=1 Tax=Limnobaculum eriocheiris TaxID=2897391 RepID=A0A9X1SPX1_9GAMM|nr:Der GTPase-activating protein YihI [Limnobaculum eriocheiris]MCD1126517.1 Der GTPase-activating protein YihI [Limnobaculum eriocheiris]